MPFNYGSSQPPLQTALPLHYVSFRSVRAASFPYTICGSHIISLGPVNTFGLARISDVSHRHLLHTIISGSIRFFLFFVELSSLTLRFPLHLIFLTGRALPHFGLSALYYLNVTPQIVFFHTTVAVFSVNVLRLSALLRVLATSGFLTPDGRFFTPHFAFNTIASSFLPHSLLLPLPPFCFSATSWYSSAYLSCHAFAGPTRVACRFFPSAGAVPLVCPWAWACSDIFVVLFVDISTVRSARTPQLHHVPQNLFLPCAFCIIAHVSPPCPVYAAPYTCLPFPFVTLFVYLHLV